jgi:uncharacterized protein YjbI with pentapeptide repeats
MKWQDQLIYKAPEGKMTNAAIFDALINLNSNDWNLYKKNLTSANFDEPHYLGINQRNILSIIEKDISGKDFSDFDLSDINFIKSDLSNCKFLNCSFNGSQIQNCIIYNTDFSHSDFREAAVLNCKCNNNTKFISILADDTKNKNPFTTRFISNFEGVDFKNANFNGIELSESSFLNANLDGTTFRRSNLSNTSWQNAIISEKTDFQLANFSGHSVTRDKSDLIKFSPKNRNWLFNWGSIRFISTVPLLEFSWITFLVCLFIVNSIIYFNETTPKVIDGLNEIPIPLQLIYTIISSLLLAFGSTIYKFFCPEQVKQFSFVEWVYEHGHPGVQYLSYTLQKPNWQKVSITLSLIGAIIGLTIIATKIFSIFIYIFYR